jgi:PIN domain nuclease of toxin-antitoxin system
VSSGIEAKENEKKPVLDASAILVWLLVESGAGAVEAALPAVISAVNMAEVVYCGVRRGLPIIETRRALSELPLTVIPFQGEQIYLTAELHCSTRERGLSLADCVCISLAAQLGVPVLTADGNWKEVSLPASVQFIR